jgi:ABC-type uncharacterized transport system substrate-binding protein
MRRIGLLSALSPADAVLWYQAFRLGLRDLGWVEGKNISIEYRYAEGRNDLLADLAADLVRLKVDVIVATAPPDALAAQKATKAIPIVIAAAGDPVAFGLVESLARPGGNITGLSQMDLKRIAGLAAKSRLPSILHLSEFADAGGLVAYGADRADLFRRAAAFVDKIFKGAKPSDLPIDQATKIELVINMKTAKALGITIPQSVLFRADRVIE